jgi:hypothetical protein
MTDADIWGDPENFRPERFIAPDGSLIRKEELIPFGIGRSLHNFRLYECVASDQKIDTI